MKLSQASLYAVRSLVHMVQGGPEKVYASHNVAAAEGIPNLFLLKVLKSLVNARLLSSLKGPAGGYRLARAPKEITLLDVVEAVEGPVRGDAPFLGTENALDDNLLEVCNLAAESFRKQLSKVRLTDLAKSK